MGFCVEFLEPAFNEIPNVFGYSQNEVVLE